MPRLTAGLPRLVAGLPRLVAGLRRARRDDRGAVSVIVAVLLAGGVLLGMTAIVVDVGQIYVEREELQSGADAAAMAIALDCAKGRPGCSTGVGDTATSVAAMNARDGQARADALVCRRGGGHPDCRDRTADNLADCLGSPPAGADFVQVRTSTETRGGEPLLPPTFAGALIPGYSGTSVGACARVAWGVPRAASLGVTFSSCEWAEATDDGSRYAPVPPARVRPGDRYERVLMVHDPRGRATCPAGPAGTDRPGGFGWIDADGECRVAIVPSTYEGRSGASGTRDCREALEDAVGEVSLVPIYRDVDTRRRGDAEYRLHGMAAFVVTGFSVPGRRRDSTVTGRRPCARGEFCISGYFVESVDSSGPPGSALPYLGAATVKTIG